jgi:hypothetical protein
VSTGGRSSGCIVLGVVGVLLLLCAATVPFLLFENNPPVRQEPPWDSPQTRALAQRACFDCHSNQTIWPVYDKIPPGSWLAVFDTLRGRRHLNFSEWGTTGIGGERGQGVEDVVRAIQDGSMPPRMYTMLHPAAVLNQQAQQQLIDGLQKTLQ